MKLLKFLFILFPFSLYAQIEKEVLFVGNSYTYVNNLPDLINQIAIDKGNQLMYESHTPGGATLAQHASNSNVQYLLNTNEWDFVVLQEQSQYPAFPPFQVASEVYPYAESLCNDIYESADCVKPIFFMTWGRENGDIQNCKNYPPICTYEGMQDRLIESYTEMAQSNQSLLAPVGIAWKELRENFTEINLYASDGSHPSIHGSYLAACVFYSIIFNDSPQSSFIPDGISDLEAEQIQSTVLNMLSETTTNFSNDVTAYGSYELYEDQIYFYNESEHALEFNWTGITQNIISYEDTLIVDLNGFSDTYEIMLIAEDNCSTSEYLIQITDLNLDQLVELNLPYPNPSNGLLYLNGNSHLITTISIYSSQGKCVFYSNEFSLSSLNLHHLTEGVYHIIIRYKDQSVDQFSWVKKK